MAKDELEELKKLSPKERIAKLKEIQEKDKKEIEQAQELIKESEEQAEKEDEKEKIPIPQVKSADIDSLFSAEEKQLFMEVRLEQKKQKTEETPEEKKEKKESLEEVAAEAPKLPEEQQEKAHIQYLEQQSQKPADMLYNRTKEIYSEAKDKGYVSPKHMNELRDIEYATRKKMEDIEQGKYTDATKEAARDMVMTERIKNWLEDKYESGTLYRK
ncbi:hypothetical protein GF336_04685 [Candidatus Woesearchaeota archaeon]|nr:hypothetical protein [Candidatus Woesearchaeota archaeon]